MILMPDRRIGAPLEFRPLPALADSREILADALPLLEPPSRMTVTEAAERYVRVQSQGAWTHYDREATPYMVEPTDSVRSRLFRTTAFMGPSQSGKTMALQTIALHAVTCEPNPVLIVHMSRPERDKWVEEKLNPLILNSPEIHDRLGKGRDDSTFSRKRFLGMRLTIGYPTPQVLSGGTYQLVLLTDLDHMPLVLGGADNPEGSPPRMARQRIRTFLSRGAVFAESSPAYPALDPSWSAPAETPHALPPVAGGIAQLYNQGTRARLYWECPCCGEEFEPRFSLLHYDQEMEPGAAGRDAVMICPHNGCVIEHRQKVALNRAILKDRGGWRHEATDGRLVALHDRDIRKTEVVSYALNGAAAAFSTWAELVESFEAARRKFLTLGDDTDLATHSYTEVGLPYVRPRRDDDTELDAQFLKDHAAPGARGIVPSWAAFITVTVDVQGSYFPVQVTAWGADGQSQIVDRFDLTQPPVGAPGGQERKLDPGKWGEDWDVLAPLAERAWPVEGADHGLKAAALVVDFQGAPGVSDNAEAFWHGRRDAGQGRRWFLSRGQPGWKAARFWYGAPERKSGGGKGRKIKLLTIGTDRMKDTVSSAFLKASGDGAGAMRIGQWMLATEHADWIAEFVAEERLGKGWDKKAGQVRNEGFDLCVQARAVAEHLGLLKLSSGPARSWATPGAGNSLAVDLRTAGAGGPQADARADARETDPPARKKQKSRGGYRVTKMNFLER
ncbi:terminase gpA endonuclease subunit [Marinibacterium sp. SX1]|uniref:terminase gpA endonuclease subunit n=1 Tax=Marinibacterium sp. SX1 TaxID=3388424 RepID=UPI003D17EFF2